MHEKERESVYHREIERERRQRERERQTEREKSDIEKLDNNRL